MDQPTSEVQSSASASTPAPMRGPRLKRPIIAAIAAAVVIVIVGVGAYAIVKNRSSVSEKPYHIGILSGFDAFADIGVGFKQGMEELGYIEGRDVVYDFRRLNVDLVGTEAALKEFIAADVDLIFTFPTEPAVIAKRLTQGTDMPVVFSISGIEETGLVNSIREPGGNVTGVRYPGPELTIARFDFLRELVPGMKRLFIAYHPEYPAVKASLDVLRQAAAVAGITLDEAEVRTPQELKAALDARSVRADIGIDAILIMPENVVQSPAGWPLISTFAASHRLPIGGSAAFEADAGAVFSYIPDSLELGRLGAPVADKILRGVPPGEIPVITPESVLRFNYKLARELGLTVSENFLRRADEIIR